MAVASPKADASWIPEFAVKYAAWFPAACPLIEAHRYAEAFKTYPYPAFTGTPWVPVTAPLAAARLSVVTTAGVYRRGVDPPFEDTAEGDPRVLALPSDGDLDGLEVSHSHIPQELVRSDLNVVLPLGPLRDLVREGRLGALAPRVWSLVGYQTRAHEVAAGSAPAIAAGMADDQVTLALVVPV